MQNLIDYLGQFVTEERSNLFSKIIEHRTRYITVVLEDIFQSHNASAVLRTCECFGIQDVHIIENSNEYTLSPEVALGSDKWLTLHKHNDLKNGTSDVYKYLRSKGYRIVATTPHNDDVTLQNFDLAKGKSALIFGTELNGLSPEAIAGADEYIKIPMYGFTESFNISVSASIILYQLTERLYNSEIDWSLSEGEKLEIRLEWLRRTIKSSEHLEKKFLDIRE